MLYNMLYNSEVITDRGLAYYNPYSFDLNTFNPQKEVSQYELRSQDIKRFDLFINKIYGSTYYEQFILLVNAIVNVHLLPVGYVINLYETSDIDIFLQTNSMSTT